MLRFAIETVAVADLPIYRPDDRRGIAEYVALRQAGSEPPPLVVYRNPDGSFDIYDGRRRAIAAKETGAATIRAAVCPSRGEAERLRARINAAGGATNYWAAHEALTV